MEQSDVKSWRRIDQLSSQGVQDHQSSESLPLLLDAAVVGGLCGPSQKRRALLVDLCAGSGAVGLF